MIGRATNPLAEGFTYTGRRRPYTERGLRRKRCERCKWAKATEQWAFRSCALGGPTLWMPMCGPCDAELNAMVLAFLGVPNARRIAEDYAR